jgi:nucleoside-diphosphate-sugar epimerase
MRIAIMGCTSQIAKDFILNASRHREHELFLYGRNVEGMNAWLNSWGLSDLYSVHPYEEFHAISFEAVLNFVGVGDPSKAAQMGASIFDITLQYDEMVMDSLRLNPECRYIFLSSGAAYGSTFLEPANENAYSHIALNNFAPQEYYSVAKLHAECRHRAKPDHHIVDLRVFNYFSRTQDIGARFLITDIVRSILSGVELLTSADFMMRDFLHPNDFYQMIDCVLKASPANCSFDCYSAKPVSKTELLDAMSHRFGLRFSVVEQFRAVNATGAKPYYYSVNHRAGKVGYQPRFSSLETVISETEAILESIRRKEHGG